ncbi:hypothetical protein SLE2022_101730 [Rubroshorea leprosula]
MENTEVRLSDGHGASDLSASQVCLMNFLPCCVCLLLVGVDRSQATEIVILLAKGEAITSFGLNNLQVQFLLPPTFTSFFSVKDYSLDPFAFSRWWIPDYQSFPLFLK